MTKIYLVTAPSLSNDGLTITAKPKLKDAKSAAREVDGTVDEIELKDLSKRDLLCALFNRDGYGKKPLRVYPKEKAKKRK